MDAWVRLGSARQADTRLAFGHGCDCPSYVEVYIRGVWVFGKPWPDFEVANSDSSGLCEREQVLLSCTREVFPRPGARLWKPLKRLRSVASVSITPLKQGVNEGCLA